MASIMSLVDHESRSTNRGFMCSVSISAHLSSAASALLVRILRDGPKAGPLLPHHLQAGKETAGRKVKATEPDAMPCSRAARYAVHRIPPVNELARRRPDPEDDLPHLRCGLGNWFHRHRHQYKTGRDPVNRICSSPCSRKMAMLSAQILWLHLPERSLGP